jgi:hypothetical protein
MPKYHIHFYDTLRIKIIDVEADSTKEAIEKAEEMMPHPQCLEISRPGCWETEPANERTCVLVDPLDNDGEVMYDHSFFYDWPGYVQRPWRAVVLLKNAYATMAASMPLSLVEEIFDFLKEIEDDKIKDLPHPLIQPTEEFG